MFDIEVTEEGFDKVIQGLISVDIGLNGELTWTELDKMADRILEIIDESLSNPYPPASLPFEAPHERKGDLRKGIVKIPDMDNLKIVIASTTGYGIFLELGTSKMEARPFMFFAVFQALEEFKQAFPERIKEYARSHVNR